MAYKNNYTLDLKATELDLLIAGLYWYKHNEYKEGCECNEECDGGYCRSTLFNIEFAKDMEIKLIKIKRDE